MTTCISCGHETKKFGSFKTKSVTVQRFRCLNTACGKTFNEQRRFIGLCLDESKIVQIVRCLSEGCGVIQLRTIAGLPDVDKICTSHVERLNLTVRTFNRRFTRLCVGWSRKLQNHRNAVALFAVAYNFCKRHQTLSCTPAVGARLTDHVWTIEELITRLSETI